MPKTKKEILPYETSDITFAAVLMCLGKKLEYSYRSGRGNEMMWQFKNEDGDIDDLFAQFVNGDIKVDPNTLTNNIRNLKASIYGKL